MFLVKEDAQARFDVCKACDSFIRPTRQCAECGCLMTLKVKFASSTCPLGKW